MIRLNEILSTPLESSFSKTPEYKSVVRKAMNRLRKILGNDFEVPTKSMPHFEFSVMIHNKKTDKWAHYFTGDLRGGYSITHVVRSAKSNTDFSGGPNEMIHCDFSLESLLINYVNNLTA
jgi:hypothetical protein